MRLAFPTCLLIAAIPVCTGASTQAATFRAHAVESITEQDGRNIIGTLASDEFAGRMTGQPGQHQTAQLAAEKFASWGLTPMGDDGTFLQHFELATNVIHDAGLTVEGQAFEFGPDFISRGDGGSGNVTAECVYVGRGISDPEQHFDEYAGIDATGKIVVALRGSHPEIEGDWGLTGWKARAAKEHGAVGMILLEVNAEGQFGGLIGSVYYSNGDIPWDPSFPAIQGNHKVAKALFSKCGQNLPELIGISNTEKKPMSLDLGTTASLMVDTTMNLANPTENVIGFIEGSDPKLKDEVIVLGAHMDHVGVQGEGLLFSGQEDNASGTATVLELAQAFATASVLPKRSMLFMLYTGEEMGLYGSKYWIAHPTLPLSRVKLMLNFDMTGQGTQFMVHNGVNTPQIDTACKTANTSLHQLEYLTNDVAAASDHVPFWVAGIPAVMFLNGGERKYPVHQLGDFQDDGCNWPLWEQVTETAAIAAWDLANASKITDRVPQEAMLAAAHDMHAHDHGTAQYHACW